MYIPTAVTTLSQSFKDLHPLSVEDVLHRGSHALSKADYYPKHLFIRVLCHTLSTSQPSETAVGSREVGSSSLPFTQLPRSASPQRFDEKFGTAHKGTYENGHGIKVDPMADVFGTGKATLVDPEVGGRSATLLVCMRSHFTIIRVPYAFFFPLKSRRSRRSLAELTLDELKKEDRVGVHIEPMCIFLCRDGKFLSSHLILSSLTRGLFVRNGHIVYFKAKS